MSVYVEIVIRAPIDAIWTHTQTAALHERWDLRFTRIDALPRPLDAGPQRFRYTTRLAFGLEVRGVGEAAGERALPDGSRSSALRFGSDDPRSIIRDGSGYWKYVPTGDGVRFFTRYDYRTRWNAAGERFDRLVFRPFIGWATAWSFDRLRLWLEDGVDPRSAARHTLVHAVVRLALAAVFAYQGAVPKLLMPHHDEFRLAEAAGIPPSQAAAAVAALGTAEIAMAIALVAAWSRSWPVWLCLLAMPVATLAVARASPAFFGAAFNPFSLNVCVTALAIIDLLVVAAIPSARRCRRRPASEVP
jgi:hypothetical protein